MYWRILTETLISLFVPKSCFICLFKNILYYRNFIRQYIHNKKIDIHITLWIKFIRNRMWEYTSEKPSSALIPRIRLVQTLLRNTERSEKLCKSSFASIRVYWINIYFSEYQSECSMSRPWLYGQWVHDPSCHRNRGIFEISNYSWPYHEVTLRNAVNALKAAIGW